MYPQPEVDLYEMIAFETVLTKHDFTYFYKYIWYLDNSFFTFEVNKLTKKMFL